MESEEKVVEKSRKHKFIIAALPVIVIVCLIPVGRAYYLSVEREKQQEFLKDVRTMEKVRRLWEEDRRQEKAEIIEKRKSGLETEDYFDARQPVMLKKFTLLYEENNDLAGWLSIEGMVIDYPVMQCENDEYYLHHDFNGKEDKYGCLYVRGKADINTPDTNFIIYGHNMRDGSMFGDLDLYKEKSFYLEHSTISFDTLYEERTYEIVAVFLSKVYNENEDVFKYYQFYSAETEEEFDYFYTNIKELSLYDTGVTAEFGDTFLTLSTCAYHVKDGRLAVVAKRVE